MSDPAEKPENEKTEPVDALAELRRVIAERDQAIAEAARLKDENARLSRENALLQQKVDELSRELFGKSAEKVDATELAQAANESREAEPPAPPPFVGEAMDVEEADADERKKRKRKKGHGRRPLPDHLPRDRNVHELGPEARRCPICGAERRVFGEDVRCRIDYVPASVRIIEDVRLKYSCADCQGEVICAPLPPVPIEKGRPGAGLLAFIANAKYGDHLPLYRLVAILARDGVDLPRSTLCDWVKETAWLLRPIVSEMARSMKRGPVIGADETGVLVLDRKAKGGTRRARMWAYRGALGEVVFQHTATKATLEKHGPAEFLAGYRGKLQADAANVFDALYKSGEIVEVGCMAHCRRKFFKAKDAFPRESGWALAAIRSLYKIEADAKEKGLSVEERRALRQAKAKPIADGLFAWLRGLAPSVPAGTLLATAVGYALNQEAALKRYLDDGRLSIDNNAVERALRQVAVGRNAWLFAGSAKGAEVGATLYSLVVSCRELGVDPWAYLRDVIERVSTHPASAVAELTPRGWHAAHAAGASAPAAADSS